MLTKYWPRRGEPRRTRFYGPSLYCFDAGGQESEACEIDHKREVMKTIEATKCLMSVGSNLATDLLLWDYDYGGTSRRPHPIMWSVTGWGLTFCNVAKAITYA